MEPSQSQSQLQSPSASSPAPATSGSSPGPAMPTVGPMSAAADRARDRIERSIRYMADHLDVPVTREALAAAAGVNPEHYSRIFKKYKGTNPLDYLTRLRMERACELLREGRSVQEVGRMVGFADPYHFSRRFKQAMGVAPTHMPTGVRQPRIVALDGYGHCRALGLDPLGADSGSDGGWAHWPDGLTDLRGAVEPIVDAARFKAFRPDVIITSRAEWVGELSAVCPVVHLQVHEDPIHTQLFELAARFGKEEAAAEWVARYERRRELLRDRVAASVGIGKVALLRVREGLLQIYGTQNMTYPLYRSLELSPPDKIVLQSWINSHFHSSVISIEELPFYNAEHLFVVPEPDAGGRREWTRIRRSDVWSRYPAVRSGSVHELDVRRWLAYDPESIFLQMEEAAERLTGRTGEA